MMRTMLRLAVAILAFFIGLVGVKLHLLNSAPPVEALEPPPLLMLSASFPGLSVRTQTMGRLLYFPPNVFSNNEGHNQSKASWYSEHLRVMNEPSLYFPDDSEAESYRFLWLRSFHHPVAVRIWQSGGDHFITLKQLSGAGGYEPGRLVINRTRAISRVEWEEFIRLLEQASYWNLPTDDYYFGHDGAQWILEGVRGGRYHIVDRWSPNGGNYRAACFYLLVLSGLEIDASAAGVY